MPKIDTDTEEGKAELQKLIDKETEGLKAKNNELIDKQKKLKDEMKSFQDQLDDIKEAKEKAEEDAAKKSGDVEAITKSLEAKYTKKISELEGKLTDSSSKLNKIVIDQGITEALTKAGVAPQYLDAAALLIKHNSKSEVLELDGKAIAHLDGKPITDFVSEWTQGESGKHYVAAKQNGGGGSDGDRGKAATPKQIKQSDFDAMSPKERAAVMAGGDTTII